MPNDWATGPSAAAGLRPSGWIDRVAYDTESHNAFDDPMVAAPYGRTDVGGERAGSGLLLVPGRRPTEARITGASSTAWSSTRSPMTIRVRAISRA